MNRTRLIGFVVLTIGAILQLFVENDLSDFLSGLFIGAGFGLLISGKLNSTSK